MTPNLISQISITLYIVTQLHLFFPQKQKVSYLLFLKNNRVAIK